MRTRVFNFAVAGSLVVTLVTAVLWIRSRSYDEQFLFRRVADGAAPMQCRWWEICVATAGSQIDLAFERNIEMLPKQIRPLPGLFHRKNLDKSAGFGGTGGRLERFGFGCDARHVVGAPRSGMAYDRAVGAVFVPLWFLFLLTLVLPAVKVLLHFRKRSAELNNICAVCGYDLRATPTRCPECGTAVAGLSDAAER